MKVEAGLIKQQLMIIQGALKIFATLQLNRYPETTCLYDGESFDYIVVGGGTAGCIVASRLVEDKKTSVLLIEAGKFPTLDNDMSGLLTYGASGEVWVHPVDDSTLNTTRSLKSTHSPLVTGKCLGGSSTTNYLMYSSGSKHEYNEWAQIVNDTAWNWENVLPYLKKSQRLEVPSIIESDSEFYGLNGSIGLITFGTTANIDTKPYFNMYKETGNEISLSVNGNNSLGYALGLYIISKGMQQNTALGYIMPKKNYPNLHILKNTIVTKIIFDANKRAVGVKASICNNRTVIIKAKREVIISAGVVNTPKLLMISGVGPKEHLCKHKIKTISNLPVGENFQSQIGLIIAVNMTNTVMPYRPSNPYTFPLLNIMGYETLNKSKDYPDYQAGVYISQPRFLMEACTKLFYFDNSICNNLFGTDTNSQNLLIYILKQRYKSKGRILLRSSNSSDLPIIYTGYYTEKEDFDTHLAYVRDNLQVVNSKTFIKLGGQIKDPGLPKCGKMNLNSTEYWKCYFEYMLATQHKYCGTCAIGSVVDSRLRVYGVKKLRVVDSSVMPNLTLGGTLGPTIMVGEKGADMIKEDRYK